jgi:hypothetical protein
LGAASHSTVDARESWNPDGTGSTCSTIAVSRTRDPTGTGAGKRALPNL